MCARVVHARRLEKVEVWKVVGCDPQRLMPVGGFLSESLEKEMKSFDKINIEQVGR